MRKTMHNKPINLTSGQLQSAKLSPIDGLWLKFKRLNVPEQFVCANILLIPIWWLSGLYRYWPLSMAIVVAIYEYRNYGLKRLRYPTTASTLLFCFSAYQCIGLLLFSISTSGIGLSSVSRIFFYWIPTALIFWYCQSIRVRLRVEPIAWCFSVLAIQMLAFWVVGQIILGGGHYNPPKAIFASLSGTSGDYESGKGLSNYLMPYDPEDVSIPGSARWYFFFIIPEIASIVGCFISLLALEIKQPQWSLGLLFGGIFTVLVSGTRSTWILLPFIMVCRYALNGNGPRRIYSLLGLVSLVTFIGLTFPEISKILIDLYQTSSESVSSYRGLSADIRGEIYSTTLAEIPNQLFFGHWIRGRSLLYGSELARVGSHSFLVSTLGYRLGLVGTSLFIGFWFSLLHWLYKSRRYRPIFCFLIWFLYTVLSIPMEFGETPAVMMILVAVLLENRPLMHKEENQIYSL